MEPVPLPEASDASYGSYGPYASYGRTLVAGIGNIFLGDDGFGVETLRRLSGHQLPPDVDLMDTGIRGVHLAYRLLDGYRRLILVDTVDRGAPPGTVHVLEVDPADPGTAPAAATAMARLDGHAMDPASVLRLVHELRAGAGGQLPEWIVVVGCQPLTAEEGIGLSAPVAAAVGPATELVLDLVGGDERDPRDARDTGEKRDEPRQGAGSDLAVGLRRRGHGRGGVRDGEVRPGPAPLSADPPDVRAAGGTKGASGTSGGADR
ncbi:hydrogenase maturation protease [Streptomyces sp. MnatMP-M17]|uniref:hydrogenase maturation protease n=1 Tax=Streptomyces sp. SID4917 TaxID=2690269 RepID=UPI00081DB2EF|nr:hydrogenase maturation protease [Streptomyces sp. MnatMP-M17]